MTTSSVSQVTPVFTLSAHGLAVGDRVLMTVHNNVAGGGLGTNGTISYVLTAVTTNMFTRAGVRWYDR